jgi:hypothetical protein
MLAAPVVVLVAISTGAGDETFAPKGGGYTICYPGKPRESTQTAKTMIGDVKITTATYATSDGNVYMVSYNDFPEGATKPENRNSLYDGVREGIKGRDGKLIGEEVLAFGADKLPGREYVIDKGKQRMKFRVVLRDNRMYQVAVIGTNNFVAGKEAKSFLDSFALTK